jgi:hypothetical protein
LPFDAPSVNTVICCSLMRAVASVSGSQSCGRLHSGRDLQG